MRGRERKDRQYSIAPGRNARVVGGGEAVLDSDDGGLAEDEFEAVGEVCEPLEGDALHAI